MVCDDPWGLGVGFVFSFTFGRFRRKGDSFEDALKEPMDVVYRRWDRCRRPKPWSQKDKVCVSVCLVGLEATNGGLGECEQVCCQSGISSY